MDEIRTVYVENVDHNAQRYETAGDWVYQPDAKTLQIFTSILPDWRESFCVAVHEQIEAAICVRYGIKQEDVDAFDIAYEKRRPEGDESEPGDDPDAPYYHAHQIATQCERILSHALGLIWTQYDAHVGALEQTNGHS